MPAETVRPPRPELIALLDAVKDHPDDDTPRLVLADWLDEQDNELDAARAKNIRKDIARERGTLPPAANMELRVQAALFQRCLGPLAAFPITGEFFRGLPHITIDGPALLQPAFRPLFASEEFAFVQFVQLNNAGGPRMEAMASLPEFRHVPGLGVYPFNPLGTGSAATFFGSPNLTGLRHIAFRSVQPGAVGVQALAANPALSRLRKLAISHNKLVDKAVAALAAGKHLTNLEVLDLSDNHIGDKGAESLATSKAFPNLRELNLRECPRLTASGKQLLRDKFGERVKLD